jgi:hypothetical protein
VAIKPKAIVLWGREDLLDSSIESILISLNVWQVVCVSSKESLDALYQAVNKVDPDFVIIRYEENNYTPLLPMQLIHDHPAMTVIAMGFKNNSMEVYSKQTIVINKVSDLISVLENKN